MKIVDKGYGALQSLASVIRDQIKMATTQEFDRERLKCLHLELTSVPTLSASGYFYISKSTLVSMMSVRKVII